MGPERVPRKVLDRQSLSLRANRLGGAVGPLATPALCRVASGAGRYAPSRRRFVNSHGAPWRARHLDVKMGSGARDVVWALVLETG
jgi:hypothetical protein